MSEVVDHWTYPLRRGETVADQDWVPIYFHKLLGSRLVARACAAGAEGRAAGFAAMLLWFEAVRQDPAGTLPDDDVELARLAGYGPDVQAWRGVRALALHGWRPCHVEAAHGPAEEDRLGHDLVAEIVVYAWERKSGRRRGREAARLSHAKWKVRRQMEVARRPARLIADDTLVTRVAEWLIQSGLPVSRDNVASGLAMAGVPVVISVGAGGAGPGADGSGKGEMEARER